MSTLRLGVRNVLKMLTHIYTLLYLKTTPNTVTVLICFQKYAKRFFKKVIVRSKALCETQHKNLVVIVSKHTDTLGDWSSLGWKETALSLYTHTSNTYAQNLRKQTNITQHSQ